MTQPELLAMSLTKPNHQVLKCVVSFTGGQTGSKDITLDIIGAAGEAFCLYEHRNIKRVL